MTPIAFYLPRADWPPFDRLPTADELAHYPRRFLSPALNWTWRTYVHLRAAGFACTLVDRMPPSGVVVAAACNLPLFFRPSRRQLLVCCVADSPAPFFTQLNVYQCRGQAERVQRTNRLPEATYVPHWPQPGILPRAALRGTRFENVSYFGAPDQLAPDLQSPGFAQAVQRLGLTLRLHFDHYHDYTHTDAVLAIRHFDHGPIFHKPASKLVNAWLAGVPAILGPEEGFRELRQNADDYFEARSVADCLARLTQLRDDEALRKRMQANARRRAAEFSTERLVARWRGLLEGPANDAYQSWSGASRVAQQSYFLRQWSRRLAQSLRRRLSGSLRH